MEELKQKEAADLQKQLTLTISRERLEVTLSCTAEYAASERALEGIQQRLDHMGIKAEVLLNALTVKLQDAKTNTEDIVDLIVARGAAPTLPIDGKVEWTKDYFADGYYVDPETHRIDYHQKAAAPSVSKDELLVIVHPPEPGQDGTDVNGRTIKAVRARAIDLRAGTGVTWDAEAGGFRASCSGQVRLRGNTLEVDEILRVRGDVDSHGGNIDHKGSVVIDGDVESEFKVRAEGDIEVHGKIGASTIDCGGNLIAKSGIKGDHETRITVKGNIESRYIEQAKIEAIGNVKVEKEIFQSTVHACGSISCEGRVLGGEVIAAKGLRVGEAGSKNNTRTLLAAGIDHRLLTMIKACINECNKTKDTIQKLSSERKKIQMLGRTMTHEQKETLMGIEYELSETEQQLEELTEKRKELRKKFLANSTATIHIENEIYPGTILRVVDSQYEVEHILAGPMVAQLDPATREIALSSEEDDKSE